MQIRSELLLASINSATNQCLFTFKWVYPRMILPEILTHRSLSRNTASTRAIPTKRQVAAVWEDPFVPSYIGANQKGMQAGEELSGWRRSAASLVWRVSRLPAIAASLTLDALGVHKQICGRLIEPYAWTTQLVSATDLDGLFAQRCHESAEPHFQELAKQAEKQVSLSKSFLYVMQETGKSKYGGFQVLKPGEWHLPFITPEDEARANVLLTNDDSMLRKISAARCARVSYNMPDTGKPSTVEQDLVLFKRLAESKPGHYSPLEHVAMAESEGNRSGNFSGGWLQMREEYDS